MITIRRDENNQILIAGIEQSLLYRLEKNQIAALLTPSERRLSGLSRRSWSFDLIRTMRDSGLPLKRWAEVIDLAMRVQQAETEGVASPVSELADMMVAFGDTVYKLHPMKAVSTRGGALAALKASIMEKAKAEVEMIKMACERECDVRLQKIQEAEYAYKQRMRGISIMHWPGGWELQDREGESVTYWIWKGRTFIREVIDRDGSRWVLPKPIPWSFAFHTCILQDAQYSLEDSYAMPTHPHSGNGKTCLNFREIVLPETLATLEDRDKLQKAVVKGLSGINYRSLLRTPDQWDQALKEKVEVQLRELQGNEESEKVEVFHD